MNPAIIHNLKLSIEALRYDIAATGNDDDEALLEDMLEGETDLDGVLSKLVRTRQRAKADGIGAAHAKKEASAHYDRRMAAAERIEDHMSALIVEVLEASGLSRRKVPEGSISLTPPRQSLVVTDPGSLPQGYYETVRKPLTAAIKEALQEGVVIPGAELVMGSTSVRIV